MVRATAARHRPLIWVRCGHQLGHPHYRTCRRILAQGDIPHGPFTDIHPDHASLFEGRTGHHLEALISQLSIDPHQTPASRPHIRKTEYAVHTQYGDGFRLQVTCKCGAAWKIYTRSVADTFAAKLTGDDVDLTRPVDILTTDL